MVIEFEKLTSHWIPCSTIGWNWMISIVSYNTWQKNAQQLACFYLELYFGRESNHFLAQLQSKAILIMNQLLSNVSSTMCSEILFLFGDDFLLWRNFWIHFHIATWPLLTKCRYDNALTTFLNDSPRKYKYRL